MWEEKLMSNRLTKVYFKTAIIVSQVNFWYDCCCRQNWLFCRHHNNNHDNVYGAVIMTKVIARVHPVHLTNADWAPGSRQHPDHASPLRLWVSAENWQLPSTSTIAVVIITQPIGWYSFFRPTEGRRLSRPRHCSKGAQPVPKHCNIVLWWFMSDGMEMVHVTLWQEL